MHILILHGDLQVGRQLQEFLERQGHHVFTSSGVPEALLALEAQPADLVIAECRQLELNGASFFRSLSRWPQPPAVLPLNSHPAPSNTAALLPVQMQRLGGIVAEAQRLLSQGNGEVIRVGDLAIDMGSKRVTLHGQQVLLPPLQFRLLAYLAQNAGRVVGAQELLKAVWGYAGDESEARELVKVHVRQIRRKLGLGAQRADYVQSVRGFGYMVAAPESGGGEPEESTTGSSDAPV